MSLPDLVNSKTAGILGPILNSETVYIGWGFSDSGTLNTFLFGKGGGPTGCAADEIFPTTSIGANGEVLNLSDLNEYRMDASVNAITGEVKIQFFNTKNGKAIGLKKVNDDNVLVEGTIPETFLLNQTTYSPWSAPGGDVIALSFINYALTGEDGKQVSACFPTSFGADIAPIPNIFLVPKNWFTDCDGGSGRPVTSPLAALCAVTCATQSLQPGSDKFFACGEKQQGAGPCGKEPILGFSNNSDCTNAFRYKYCVKPNRCMGTCQSACTDDADICIFTALPGKAQVGTYSCTGPSGNGSGTACFLDLDCPSGESCVKRVCKKTVISEKEESILIVIAIVVGVVVVGVLLFVFYLYSKPTKKTKRK